MVFITCNEKYFVLASNSRITAFNLNRLTRLDIKLPELDLERNKNAKSIINNPSSEFNSLSKNDNPVCGCFSNDGSLFVVCDVYKRLIIWKINDDSFETKEADNVDQHVDLADKNNDRSWEILKILNSEKKAVELCFLNDNCLLVGDKSCDIYRYNLKTDECSLLFGHISMLLDMKICPQQKFIVTCDRDEKIRVTNYPSTYNIQTFCLGHTEFVSTCTFIDNDHIISGSGDSTIKLWEINNGKELFSFNLNDCFKEQKINDDNQLVNETNDKTADNTNDLISSEANSECNASSKQSEDRLAIKKLFFIQSNIVVVTFFNLSNLVAFKLENEKLILDRIVELPSTVVDASLLNQQLYLLTLNDGLLCYEFTKNGLTKLENKLLCLINDNQDLLKFDEKELSNYHHLLYKSMSESLNQEGDELDVKRKRK